jgi:hypothetical protein
MNIGELSPDCRIIAPSYLETNPFSLDTVTSAV